jgi:hypothetical protein
VEKLRTEFTARYFVESPDPLPQVAEIIAGEQSSLRESGELPLSWAP